MPPLAKLHGTCLSLRDRDKKYSREGDEMRDETCSALPRGGFSVFHLKYPVGGGGGGTPYNGPYGEAPPKRGTFFRL